MEMVLLAAIIEAIFTVMGKPNPALRQCPLALDKWLELEVGLAQTTILGLPMDTNKLTVAVPPSYVNEVLEMIIDSTWNLQ